MRFAARFWQTDMTDKHALRTHLSQQRDAIPKATKKELDRRILQAIQGSPAFRRANKIFLYAPVKSEINLFPLAFAAQKAGKRIAFPRCDTETEQMQFFELLPGKKLILGAYGIPEPPADAPLCKPDEHTLCILPALTCDPFGYRLGYGKGYYDKYLTTFGGTTVCAVYEGLLSPTLPHEAHDIPAQFICTEKGVRRAKGADPTVLKSGGEKSKSSRNSTSSGAKSANIDSKKQKSGVKKKGKPISFSDIKNAAKQLTSNVGASIRSAMRTQAKGFREEASIARKGVDHMPPALVLTTFVLLLLSRLAEPLFTKQSEYVGIVILQILIFILPAVLYCKLRKESFLEHIRFRLPRPSHIPLLLFALAVMITGGLLTGILTGGISSLGGNFTLYTIFVAKLGDRVGDHIAVVLAYAILPAFAEELVFRSILCAEYERHGVGVSVAVSTLFFAMLHFSFPHFLTYLLLGAILSLVLYATKSFFAVFLLHLLYNLFCLYGQPYLSAFYVTAGNHQIFLFCLVVICLLCSAFGAGQLRSIYHTYAKANADSSYTKSLPIRHLPKALFGALFSPFTAVCAVLWIIFSIVNLF